ncbi:SIR2 family protein [Bradyrhizobium sp. 155]|uniref:SIR2 family protein n=1 Tax=Bradyrhizobium sp. 155 TaxID=2782629 RepID=UPI001FFFE628|nr:SIR2 family protein [Bradyrhizobium sp. 155]UPK14702.1 SIR2 family protein [Bradyrhizobium sp. 155]
MEYFRQRFVEELNDESVVKVRTFEWPPADVFQTMAPHDYGAHFLDWVASQKQNAKDRARDFLVRFGCLDRFNRLHTQLERQSVIPFVGAGLSRPTGFPLWGAFLQSLTIDFPAVVDQVRADLAAYQYEDGAQLLLDRMGPAVFGEAVQNAFGSRIKTLKGPVQLLPLMFTRGCITTNFDYVLNRVYEASDCRLKGEFAGTRLTEAPRRLADEPHCLLRLHGEADSAQGRILTAAEYAACYGDDGNYRELFKLLIANTSLLFLGCSLSVDRTVRALREIKQAAVVETPRHFAFLPLNEGTDREARRNELGQADIHPIWYPPEDPDQAIEDLLISLLEGGFHD